jgi:hypothetical protein
MHAGGKGFPADEILSRLEADRQTGSLVVCGTREQVWAAFVMDDPVRGGKRVWPAYARWAWTAW